jgi:hypothetical protein
MGSWEPGGEVSPLLAALPCQCSNTPSQACSDKLEILRGSNRGLVARLVNKGARAEARLGSRARLRAPQARRGAFGVKFPGPTRPALSSLRRSKIRHSRGHCGHAAGPAGALIRSATIRPDVSKGGAGGIWHDHGAASGPPPARALRLHPPQTLLALGRAL